MGLKTGLIRRKLSGFWGVHSMYIVVRTLRFSVLYWAKVENEIENNHEKCQRWVDNDLSILLKQSEE